MRISFPAWRVLTSDNTPTAAVDLKVEGSPHCVAASDVVAVLNYAYGLREFSIQKATKHRKSSSGST
jgi:hypothetical protein